MANGLKFKNFVVSQNINIFKSLEHAYAAGIRNLEPAV